MKIPKSAGRMILTALLLSLGMFPAVAAAATEVQGTLGGAPYTLFVPEAWNGDLIVYAHGIVDPALPVAAPTTQDGFAQIRESWLGMGFAVASSGYRENGYALKDGAQATHQLGALFTSKFSRPRRIYLAGHSLGAAIGQVLAERHPEEYDGALLMCGFLGGGPLEVEYLTNGRILFDYFFPGAVPGGPFDVPAGLDFFPGSPTFLAALSALVAGFAPPFPTVQLASVGCLPGAASGSDVPCLPGVTPDEIVTSGLTIVGFSFRFGNDVFARTHDHIFFDNTTATYAGSFDDAALNAGVERFSSTPDAAHYFDKYYTPTGDLRIPILTLHTTRDPVNPIFHEKAYADLVERAGASDLLFQRRVDAYGHCNFTVDEVVKAFGDLRAWVETGVRPTDEGEPLP